MGREVHTIWSGAQVSPRVTEHELGGAQQAQQLPPLARPFHRGRRQLNEVQGAGAGACRRRGRGEGEGSAKGRAVAGGAGSSGGKQGVDQSGGAGLGRAGAAQLQLAQVAARGQRGNSRHPCDPPALPQRQKLQVGAGCRHPIGG